MDIKKISEELTSKEMDRKEFIASVGVAALALLGVSTVLKAFHLRDARTGGYGSSTYGGLRRD